MLSNVWCCSDAAMVAEYAPKAAWNPPDRKSVATVDRRTGEKQHLELYLRGFMSAYGIYISMWEYWGVAVKRLRDTVLQAAEDPNVLSVILHVDSPGGSSNGVAELADALRYCADRKPVIGMIDGVCASAAMHAVSGCSEVYATRGSVIGSIGTYVLLFDYSQNLAAQGIRAVLVRSSDLKAVGAFGAEITESQRQSIQRTVDFVQLQFESSVQKYRKMSKDQMKMAATGEVFSAGRAKQLGLIDDIMNVEVFRKRYIGSPGTLTGYPTFSDTKEQRANEIHSRNRSLKKIGQGTY